MEDHEYKTLMKFVEKLKKSFDDKDYLELTNNLFLLENSIKHFHLGIE